MKKIQILIFVGFVLAGCHVSPVATHHIKANTLLTFNTRKILLRKHEANGGTVIRPFFPFILCVPNGLEDGVGKPYRNAAVVVIVVNDVIVVVVVSFFVEVVDALPRSLEGEELAPYRPSFAAQWLSVVLYCLSFSSFLFRVLHFSTSFPFILFRFIPLFLFVSLFSEFACLFDYFLPIPFFLMSLPVFSLSPPSLC